MSRSFKVIVNEKNNGLYVRITSKTLKITLVHVLDSSLRRLADAQLAVYFTKAVPSGFARKVEAGPSGKGRSTRLAA